MFNSIENLEFHERIDLSQYSTMKLKCEGRLAVAKSVEAVQKFVKKANQEKIAYRVVGWGANQLLVDNATFVYLYLDFPRDSKVFEQVSDEYELPASTSLAKLTSHAAKFGLSGWEVFTGIPASLGGAIYMNAGTNLGEIGEVIKQVRIVRSNGDLEEVVINDKSFSYRSNSICNEGDVIVSAKLIHRGIDDSIKSKITQYLKLRNDTQPLNQATCGCMYKNIDKHGMTCRAGLSLDIMGLKGLSLGGVRVSRKHANFMENYDNASRQEVLELSRIVQSELALTLGLNFELEVETGEV